MPPIVVKTGSAFISNGFGRFINTNVKSEMAHGKLIRCLQRCQERADGLMPSAQSLRDCECAGRKHTSANLDPYGDWIEICSGAQDLKAHRPIISICTARSELTYPEIQSRSLF